MVDIASTDSGGRLWYDFLERLGYYVPYEKRTEKNDWYSKDMVLDNEQAKQLVDYAVKKEVYNWDGVERELWRKHSLTETRWLSTPTGS